MRRIQTPHETQLVAVLEHLTGPSRGSVSWLTGSVVHLAVGPDRHLQIAEDNDTMPSPPTASMRWDGHSYEVAAGTGHNIWINGKKLPCARLSHGDVIEFGETGPISRFRLIDGRRPLYWSVDDMFSDTLAYLRSSRRPMRRRIAWAAGDFGRRLAWETTIAFRAIVITALIILGVVTYNQFQKTAELRQSIEDEARQLQGIAADLTRARKEALQPGDLKALRDEFSQRVSATIERLETLEEESGATPRIIAQAYGSVAFLQGAYGLRHHDTGVMLRHVLNPDGLPVMSPLGQPLLSLEGDGPIAEIQFSGTAFLLKDNRFLISNRHVAMPWESGTDPERLAAQGLEPTLLRFISYFPDRPDPIDVQVQWISDTADLVALVMEDPPLDLEGLSLANGLPKPGDEVIVMGYPTGLRSMLAQSGSAFLAELQEADDTDFWSVADRLSKSGLIAPLASRGIIGQVTQEALVYDAETTHGGSGGPVLNSSGRVVAVNAAILPEFGGSNLGVPISKLRDLIETHLPSKSN